MLWDELVQVCSKFYLCDIFDTHICVRCEGSTPAEQHLLFFNRDNTLGFICHTDNIHIMYTICKDLSYKNMYKCIKVLTQRKSVKKTTKIVSWLKHFYNNAQPIMYKNVEIINWKAFLPEVYSLGFCKTVELSHYVHVNLPKVNRCAGTLKCKCLDNLQDSEHGELILDICIDNVLESSFTLCITSLYTILKLLRIIIGKVEK